MWKEIFRGYDPKSKPLLRTFSNNTDGIAYNQMIIDSGCFYSHCEHHLMPFFGTYYFAYIPDKKIVGLSKVSRIIDFHSAKLQIQERLVRDVVDELEKNLKPKGIALVIKARHLCKEMRGAKKIGGEMITSDLRGAFIKQESTKEEFMHLIKL
jgi:GTP cyclohydrolase I